MTNRNIKDAPSVSGTALFGIFTALSWIGFFGHTIRSWPPSNLFLFTSIVGLGLGLIFIGDRLRGFDARTWTPLNTSRDGFEYWPIWTKLAPFGGAFGILIIILLQYYFGTSANDIIAPLGLTMGIIGAWMVIEHIIYSSHQKN